MAAELELRATTTTSLDEILLQKKDEFQRKISATPRAPLATLEDDYHVLHTLGSGTFAYVALAKHKRSDYENNDGKNENYYAIKILRKRRVLECNQKDNILNEKKLLFALDYPFVTRLENCFKDNSNLYMVLEYVSGGEMFTHLRKKGRYSEDVAYFYSCQILLAFEYLHYLKIVYRNLIPENIVFSSDGYLKLADFGLAKIVDKQNTYTLCGTPDYMAPEIIQAKGYNKEVDWWAFGVLIYEMVSGSPPFIHLDNIKTYTQILHNKFDIPKYFGKNVASVVTGFLQQRVEDRLGSKMDASEVKQHDWFKDTNWMAIYEKRVPPPFIPNDEFDKSEFVPPMVEDIDQYGDEFIKF